MITTDGELTKADRYNALLREDPQVRALVDELEEQELELRAQNEKLRSTLDELESTNEQLLQLYHQAPVGFLTVDQYDLIINVNRTAAKLLKKGMHQLIGTVLTDLVVEGDRPAYHLYRQALQNQSVTRECVLKLMRADNAVFEARLQCSGFRPRTNPCLHIAFSDISASQRYKRIIRRTGTFQRALINSSPFAIVATDGDGVIRTINPAAECMFGYSAEELVGRYTPAQFILRHEIDAFIHEMGGNPESDTLLQILQQSTAHMQSFSQNTRDWTYVHRSGARRTMTLSVAAVYDSDAKLSGFILEAIDITHRKQQERTIRELNEKLQKRIHELHNANERANATLMAIADGVVIIDRDGQIEALNDAAESMLGWTACEARGKPLERVFSIKENEDERILNDFSKCLSSQQTVRAVGPSTLVSRAGNTCSIEEHLAPINDAMGRPAGAVLVFRDVTHNMRLIQKMRYQASHDELTGLYNRRELNKRLREVVESAKRADGTENHALLILDLDRFKAVNDTCGHTAGDVLLKQLGKLLKRSAGENATVGRVGGDEFAILLVKQTLESAYIKAMEILANIQQLKFTWGEHVFKIGASIGLKIIDQTTESVEKLQIQADTAAYSAKNAGRNRIHVYDVDSASDYADHSDLDWFNRINHAIEDHKLLLYAQTIRPLHNADTRRPHIELLLRMKSHDDKLVLPGEFIPSAERYNLMPAIDRWVIEASFKWLSGHADYLEKIGLVSINLSGPSLSEDSFRLFLQEQFGCSGIDPHKICFEITETQGILNLPNSIEFMRHFQSSGCSFAMDDFGSGFSSYQHLMSLPVDFIKIDGSFVRGSVDNEIDLAVVKAIRDVSRALGKQTIAEYVENNEILELIRDLGVDYAQGFYFDEPIFLTKSEPV